MDKRRQDLNNIRDFIQNTDKELTLLLQNLQWDHKRIVEKPTLSSCSIDSSHRIPEGSRNVHAQHCYLTHHGYSKDMEFLPDPVDITANTVVKLSTQDIQNLINTAANSDPLFKRVLMLTFLTSTLNLGTQGPEPLTVERLQTTYTADERRVIHGAVVSAAPFAHDLADLALGSNMLEDGRRNKSRAEVMAELRDMRRRRTKYRVSSKTTNYSHVLKGVIKSQMEIYAETKGMFIKTEYGSKSFVSLNDVQSLSNQSNTAPKVVTKQERISPEQEDTRNREKIYIHGKDRYSRNHYEDHSVSRDKDKHTHTKHVQERDARTNDFSRRKYREEDKYERRSRDYRNDTDERFDSNKEQKHDKYHRNKMYDRNDSSRLSRESRDRERYDRTKEHSSSRSHRDGRYYYDNKNDQKVRVKEERDDNYEGRKRRKYN